MSDWSHRVRNANSLFAFRNVSVSPKWAIWSHGVCLTNSLFAYYRNRSHQVYVIGLTRITLCPNPNEIDPTEFTFRSHRKAQRSHFELNRSDRVSWFGLTEFGKLCVTVRFWVEAIYTPSTHSSFMERAIKTCLHFQHSFSEKEPPTHVLRPRYSNPTTRILISSLPKLLSTQIIFPPEPNLCERV